MIEYRKMNLFDAPPGSILMHACNSKGVWGSGIAKTFKEKFPDSYAMYEYFCVELNRTRGTACGKASIYVDRSSYRIGWIVTSHSYGEHKDPAKMILMYTALALQEFLGIINPFRSGPERVVYSPKFNSGLFGVPWEETELILQTVLKDHQDIRWVVCEL